MLPHRVAAPLALLSLLGAGLVAITATSVSAAPPTCQGQPATIVGSPSQRVLTGTEGPDVIVSAGSATVVALGGDDVVCWTVAAATGSIDAGTGDDSVELVASLDRLVLGDGADTATAPVARPIHLDRVHTGTPSSVGDRYDLVDDRQADDDPDVLDLARTRPESEQIVFAGQDGRAFQDQVRLGSTWRSTLAVRGTGITGSGEIAGGAQGRPGGGELTLVHLAPGDAAAWKVRLAPGGAGTATSAGRRWQWIGVSDVEWRTRGEVGLTGTTGRDLFTGPVVRAALGRGEDRLTVTRSSRTGAGGFVDGGPGADRITFHGGRQAAGGSSVGLDLRRHLARLTNGRGSSTTTRFARFESHHAVSARRVVMTGGERADRLTGSSCDLAITGGAGADVLRNDDHDEVEETLPVVCRSRLQARIDGGEGDDRISGGDFPHAESLHGGAGDDQVTSGAYARTAAGRPRVYGGPGDDVLRSDGHTELHLGAFVAFGGPGDDEIRGNSGAKGEPVDALDGGPGADRLWAGEGDDVLVGGSGRDVARGGDGRDTCRRAERRYACERR